MKEGEKGKNYEMPDCEIPGYYRKGGVWYKIVWGPGPDMPMMTIGPGPDSDPRIIGPEYVNGKPTNQPLLNDAPSPNLKELVAELLAEFKEKGIQNNKL